MSHDDLGAALAEIERLREHQRRLAEEKACYQLLMRLIEKLDPQPGLEQMVRNMLQDIVECIGGTNIKIYYWLGEELRYQDFHGANAHLDAIDDGDVARVATTRAFVEQRGPAEDALLRDGALPGAWTWTFPLVVGPDLVGIVKLENLHIHGAALGKYLPIFFGHVALILANEIRNDAHRRAQAALHVATERLRLATEAGLIGIWDWDICRDELVWDASMYRLYGVRAEDFGGAYEAWLRAVHPADKAYADAEIQAALRGEREYAPEFRIVWPDGSIHHLKAASRTLRDPTGTPVRMVGINYDLTERKRAEAAQRRLVRELRALSLCNQALLRAEDEHTLLEQVCQIVCAEAGYRMAWVGFAEPDEGKTVRPAAWAGLEDGYLADAALTWADTARGRGPSGTAIRTGAPASLADFATDPLGAPWREAALARGYRSSIALPLKDGQRRTFGALSLYSTEPGTFAPDETRLLEELAEDLAFGICVLRTRAELRASEERLACAERIVHVGYWDRDLIAGKVRLSEEAYRIFGLDPAEPVLDLARWHALWERLLHPEDRPATLRAYTAALEGSGRYDVEYRVVRPSGEVRHVHSQADVTRDAAGRPVRVLGTMQDVSERKLAEEALRRSEEQYRRIVETAHEGIWAVDAAGRTTFVNRQMAAMLGYSLEEMRGALLEELVDAESRATVARHLDRRRHGIPEQQEVAFRRKDGALLWALLETTPLGSGDAEDLGALVMVTDVTDRRAMEAQLRQAQKLEAVGRLAGGVAHDFNNLLTAILGGAQFLAEELEAGHPLRGEVLDIQAAAEKAAVLTRQLLAFGRKQPAQAKVIDLGAVAAALERMLRRLIGEDVDLVTTSEPALGRVRADPLQIEQVILNLAVNARDAMPGGGRIVIETANVDVPEEDDALRLETGPGRYVRLAVRDTGTGMTPEALTHLFEPFFTTKEPGKGTGLGLSTVYGIVKQAGGDVRVQSAVGRGTSFDLYFPRVEEAADAPGPASPRAPARGAETVLVVEDEPAVRTLAVRILRRAGYEVIEASDVDDALRRVSASAPRIDLLFTDVVMPQLSGPELAARLRAVRPDLPVLFASGYMDRVSDLEAHIGTRASFIAKPFAPGELTRKIRELLDPPGARSG